MSEDVPMKRCNTCPEGEQWHPATTEFFYRQEATKDKLQSLCKECAKHKSSKRRKEVLELAKRPTHCAACGLPITQSATGIREFCDNDRKCQRAGRANCKLPGCEKPIPQPTNPKARRINFCTDNNGLCRNRYNRMGSLSATWLEERNRTKCIVCGDLILQPKKGGKRKLCNKQFCRSRNHQVQKARKQNYSLVDRWGMFAPETRKNLLEIERDISLAAAKRMATAITREYMRRKEKF